MSGSFGALGALCLGALDWLDALAGRLARVRLFRIALALFVLSAAPVSAQQSLTAQLVGTWQLVSIDTVSPDGQRTPGFGPNPSGLLMLAENGHFIMMQVPSGRTKLSTANRNQVSPEESQSVVRQAFSQFGTWTVDENSRTFKEHVEAALLPNLDGRDSNRVITMISEDELRWKTLSPASSQGYNESVYRRVK